MWEERKDETNKQEIVFFLGAGASIDAGIPDTYEFVAQFRTYVEDKSHELAESLSEVLRVMEKFNEKHPEAERKDVDVEQLLVTLERLKGKDDEILLHFYENKIFTKKFSSDDAPKLQKLLQDFIRKTVLVEKEEKLEYLHELAKFVPPTLEIFSVNYDTCVEQLCHLRNLKYTDGFDIYWNPQNLSSKDWDIKLFKLHGSVIWFESQTKEYVKIPIRTFLGHKETRLKLITGEDLTPLLVYPMQKWQYVEPLTELQLMFKKRLIDKNTKIVVVVGYSFRDDYIIRMLWDAARINNDLHIILVNPSAQEIFERRLRYLDDGKTTSRISDRVVCLPYPFRTVIYRLKNQYLRLLENCLRIEKQYANEEKLGTKANWNWLLTLCIDCEYSTKAELLFDEKLGEEWLEIQSWSEENVPDKLLLCFKALLHSSIAKDEFETKWLDRINKLLKFTNVENLRITNITNEMFSLGFSLGNSEVTFEQTCRVVETLITEVDRKSELLGIGLKPKLDRIIGNYQRLEAFKRYLSEFQNLRWRNYFKLRESAKTQAKMKTKFSRFSTSDLAKKRLQDLMLQTERDILRAIFEGELFALRLVQT